MPPRLNPLSFSRPIAYRPKAQVQLRLQPAARIAPWQCRNYADKTDSAGADRSKRIEAQPLGHVSEEAAQTAKITGEQGPELSKGTPIEEVVKGDKAVVDNLPKVMQDAIKAKQSSSPPKGSRSYSTTTTPVTNNGSMDIGIFNLPTKTPAAVPGAKFEVPSLPLPKGSHVKHRYDPVIEQVTNLLMQHGQKSKAQRNMSLILQHLRTSPIPTINPDRPLVPGAPPPSHLPLNPVLYLTLAVDSVAPLLRLRSQKGAAGGGVALQIPIPLGLRQRRRTAVQWILNSAVKRKNVGSGKTGFAQRFAQELISVVEGRSSVWDRRNAVHKLGVAARANIVLPKRR
ncbi:30S ribosomal protein-like protein S7 [Aaosphaeria arxii CBS 175.79]|uniref:Small ribosomal subunit protein uS7m n=1 Tax=Aaosphaeria arxii CBS 175.79 TaxID=1450172 RepID=A0A6A5Y889_9PLEO|nr:30S ribosomal protein-like protein S7 [Aaosphaeria arxii CBS 175.79]KAF2021030.1 30S ribosomal protein-like protein S7 [Aaosphaeria arxii CBS 175.79]